MSLLFASRKLNSLFREIRLRFVINLPLKLPAAVGFFGIPRYSLFSFLNAPIGPSVFALAPIRLNNEFAGCDVRLGFSTTSNTLIPFVPPVMHLKVTTSCFGLLLTGLIIWVIHPCLGSIYIVLDALYPASKFILTVRDEESWFRSFRAFHKARLSSQKLNSSRDDLSRWDFGYPGFAEDVLEYEFLNNPILIVTLLFQAFLACFSSRDTFVERYRHRNSSVLNYFVNRPEDLLVLDLSKEKTTRNILLFLGLPLMLETAMPHLNQRHSSSSNSPSN